MARIAKKTHAIKYDFLLMHWYRITKSQVRSIWSLMWNSERKPYNLKTISVKLIKFVLHDLNCRCYPIAKTFDQKALHSSLLMYILGSSSIEYKSSCLFSNIYQVFYILPMPSWHLLVQSQQWKHQNNVWNMFKVNNKDTKTTSLTSFWCLYC